MSRDKLSIIRPYSQALINTEAAGVNMLTLPPGLYDVEFQRGAVATITGLTLAINERGYHFNKDDTGIALGWVALNDARSRACVVANATERFFLRGVRITRWNDGTQNVSAVLTATGGPGTVANCQITFWADGRASAFNGQP